MGKGVVLPGDVGSKIPLPAALTDFRQESYWDEFFKASKGRPFEWYGEWASLPKVFRELLDWSPSCKPALQFLVPGCGNSALSATMYDAGFHNIVNVDFNKRVISEMLRLHVRARPLMKWQVMDITKMQFADGSFDVVLDKGSLDALSGEPDEPQDAALGFLAEVRRVLRDDGKYVCITLAQDHVLGLLFKNFRSGWDVAVYQVKEDTTDTAVLQPLLVVATKTASVEVSLVKSSLEEINSKAANAEQMKCVVTVIEGENEERKSLSSSLTLEEQSMEADNFIIYDELSPSSVRTVKLGGHYPAVILDAKPNSEPHLYKAAVFLVPRGRAHEWLFSTEEGQWKIVEAAKAGRLIIVMLDTQQYPGSLAAVQDELSHVVKFYLPLDCKESKDIPYMTTDDGVHRRTVLEEVSSPITGTIKVEDVVLEYKSSSDEDGVESTTTTQSFFRRLIFERNPNLIQSDAILVPYSAVNKDAKQQANKKKNKKKGKAKEPLQETKPGALEYRVDHSQLACSYHAGIVAGLSLITRNLEQSWTIKVPVRVMVVGLGAGMLPMFLHNHFPFDEIEVVELDGVIAQLAERHFGFVQTDRMKLHIGDGIQLVQRIAKQNLDDLADFLAASHVSESANSVKDERLNIIIVDADAGDSSLEMSCPPAEFLDEPFLAAAKAALVPGGMLVVNVVSRAASAHASAASKLQKGFEEVYELVLDEDVNRVLFALPRESPVEKDNAALHLQMATSQLQKLGEDFASWNNGPSFEDFLQGKLRLVPRTQLREV